jgi:hypothetical protein
MRNLKDPSQVSAPFANLSPASLADDDTVPESKESGASRNAGQFTAGTRKRLSCKGGTFLALALPRADHAPVAPILAEKRVVLRGGTQSFPLKRWPHRRAAGDRGVRST